MVKLIFLTLLLIPQHGFADEIEISNIYRCDLLFCPQGSNLDNSSTTVKERIRSTTGIITNTGPAQLPRINVHRISINPSEVQSFQQQANQLRNSEEPTSPTTNGNIPINHTNDFQATSINSQTSSHINTASQTAYSNSNKSLKAGGFLYSDDEPSSPSISGVNTKNVGSQGKHSALGGSLSAVEQNKNNASSSTSDGGSRSGTLSANMFGSFESQQSSGTKSIVGTMKNGLNDIASKLGQKFFGLSGKNSSHGKHSKTSSNLSKKKLKGISQKDLHFSKNLLKRNLSSYSARNLANKPEFAGPRSSLFENMCLHYTRYAKVNRIPIDSSPCPRN